MKRSDFFYDLPSDRIAQHPLEQRDESRLLCLNRRDRSIIHRHFYDLPELLEPGDLLIVNDSRVIPARLVGVKEGTGAAVEFLLLEQKSSDCWEAMVRPGKRLRPGARVIFGDGLLSAEILSDGEDGTRIVRFESGGSFFELLELVGKMPLPHYITAQLEDPERYQTVYAREPGSAAAPTAGLHFTNDLLDRLAQRGIRTAAVTLHVGPGTFRPVKETEIERHHMHAERYELSGETVRAITEAKADGGRIICVGTTSLRTLESAALLSEDGIPQAGRGETDIFIYPGFNFRTADGLITNFHLPESTLIMLVSAFAGHDRTMSCYREAVREGYRFYSFGDAMLIL